MKVVARRLQRKLIAALPVACLLVSSHAAFCTAFVLTITPWGVVVGADSLRSYLTTGRTESVCKIRESHGVLLIVWGNAGWTSDASLDLRGISQTFIDAKDGSAEDRDDRLFKAIESNATFLGLATSPELLAGKTGEDDVFGWAFIDSHGIFSTDYLADKTFVHNHASQIGDALFTGEHDASQSYFARKIMNGKRHTLDDAKAAVIGALQAQAALTPQWVGPPYSMVRVSDSGVEWYERGSCRQAATAPNAAP